MESNTRVSRRQFIRATGATGIAAGIAGCSSSSGSSSDGGGGGTTLKMNLLSRTPKRAVDNFEATLHEAGLSKDISIEVSTKSPGTLEDQYRQWLNAGRSEPDILTMDVGWSIPFIRRNQLLNLSESLPESAIQTLESKYNDASLNSSRGREGNIFGVPFIMDVRGLMYRKDLAKEAGYKPDTNNWGTEPKKWEEFSQIVADVQKQQNLQYGLTMPFELSQTITCCTFNAMMSQWGGAYFGGRENLFGPIGDRPITIDDEQVLQALRMLRTFIHGHSDEHALDNDSFAGQITPSDVLGWRYTKDLDAILNGNAFGYTVGMPAMALLGASDSNFGDQVNEKLGMMPKPYGIPESESQYQNIGGTASPLAGYNLSVNPNSPNTEAALEVIQTTMTDDFLARWFELSGYMPAKTDLLQSDATKGHPILGQYMDTFSVMADNAVPRPVTPIYFQESKVISQEVHNVVSKSKSPEAGMSDAKQQLKNIENNYGN